MVYLRVINGKGNALDFGLMRVIRVLYNNQGLDDQRPQQQQFSIKQNTSFQIYICTNDMPGAPSIALFSDMTGNLQSHKSSVTVAIDSNRSPSICCPRMPSSSSCTQTCGWIGAFIACICFGSFAVPIKSQTAKSLSIDPRVFQSYKTILCFLTSWIFIYILDQPITFTPWGLVSATFWVPAAVAAIYAIQNAGLAIAIALSSSCIVLVSFSWGIFIFHEKVKSQWMASLAVFLMISGIIGMSYFSSPVRTQERQLDNSICPHCIANRNDSTGAQSHHDKRKLGTNGYGIITYQNVPREEEINHQTPSPPSNHNSTKLCTCSDGMIVCGFKVSRRTTGLAAAVFNGLWGGSILVPMHFAPSDSGGIGYLISFSIGACIITLLLWIVRYVFLIYQSKGSLLDAYEQLPSFHLRKMWLLGTVAGSLWSLGNVASFFSVKYLGEAIGYSIIQAAMIVSGLWGIFYYQEVTHPMTRLLWFTTAFLAFSGIILLSYEHDSN